MAAQRIVTEMVAHQPEQSFEAFPHINRFGADVDPRRRTETAHGYAASTIRISRLSSSSANFPLLSIRRPLRNTIANLLAASAAVDSTFTLTSFAAALLF